MKLYLFNKQRLTVTLKQIAIAGIIVLVSCQKNKDQSTGSLQFLRKYNVAWDSPSKDAKGSMPVGNGDIGLNVWVEQNGDLVFTIGKTDAYDEFNRLLKLGRIRIKTLPTLYQPGQNFSQELKLADGTIEIKTDDATLRVWVDANNPVVQVDFESKKPANVKVALENWRDKARQLSEGESFSLWGNWPDKRLVNPDTILPAPNGQIIWCHHNTESQWKRNLELTGLSEEISGNTDPVLYRTFGALIQAEGFKSISNKEIETTDSLTSCSVRIFPLTKITADIQDWVGAADSIAKRIDHRKQDRFTNHKFWWQQFWNKSYIAITSSDPSDSIPYLVSRAYNLQRFVNACSGRGNLPIKFNGSIFTVEGPDPDYRAWGGGYWFQNTRLPYWSMLYSGDDDMMLPLFDMYMDALPLRRAATKKYYGHEGAFYPETMYFWGNYMDDGNYGIDRTGKPEGLAENTYIRYYWQGGLELTGMMLDYYEANQSTRFLNDTLLPFATEIMKFFDQHWTRGRDGKILLDPAASLETWHTATNPVPELAGIRYVGERLLKIPADPDLKAQWKRTVSDLPPLPMITENGQTRLLPAEKFSQKSNIENPELYPIFPYRFFTLLSDSNEYQIGLNTWGKRLHPEDFGWQQNCIQAALLGLTNEAQAMVVNRAQKVSEGYRFPAFFGPNYDWIPDQCHPSVMMIALQRMLLQCEDTKIALLPAWPKEWDVKFKLHAPYKTVLEGSVKAGNLEALSVWPESRARDVVIAGKR
ncbi:MAG: DUF5703 domain-containing protein [Mangrovibacterium sp.]|nr:DUF5703 domain-containing protein [Mangrovibacterium sp.]